jgi:hypothetical protein
MKVFEAFPANGGCLFTLIIRLVKEKVFWTHKSIESGTMLINSRMKEGTCPIKSSTYFNNSVTDPANN